MTKIHIIGIILPIISLLTGCSNLSETISSGVKNEIEIKAIAPYWSIEGTSIDDLSDTKTIRQSDGSTFWDENDKISLFMEGSISNNVFIVENNAYQPQSIVSFSGKLTSIINDNENNTDVDFWGVYPYSSDNVFDGESVVLPIKDIQDYAENTFAQNNFPAIGKSDNLIIPFYNICSGITFTVQIDSISSITFRGNDNEIVAGTVRVGFDDSDKPVIKEIIDGKKSITVKAPTNEGFKQGVKYYITVIPQTLKKGFTIDMEYSQSNPLSITSREGVYTYTEQIVLKRSVFSSIKNIDSDVNFNTESTVYTWTDLGWGTFKQHETDVINSIQTSVFFSATG